MTTQTFDDGSTFSWTPDYGVMTSSPALDYPTNVAGGFSAQRVNPSAGDWGDVLKFGLSRYIDARYAAPVVPQNAAPVYVRTPTIGGFSSGQSSLLPWLLIGGIAFLVMKK